MNDYYAIVVLGAAVREGRPSPTLQARLDAGHAAFTEGRATRFIVSGRGEAEPMRRYLVERGVPEEAIALEPHARNTWENAFFVARMVPLGARVLVCTQPSHQPRAMALFDGHQLSADRLDAMERFHPYRAIRERVAFLLYRALGWV
jgi:uncharacterized SAM-binding protein YcdF (DUF218 family)